MSLLVQQLNIEKSRLMEAVDGCANRECIDDYVRRYRAAKAARDEFCDWADDQEEEDGQEGGMR